MTQEKVAQLEKDLQTAKDENKRMAEAIMLAEVAKIVETELAKEKDIPDITKGRLTEILKRTVPQKDGKLDKDAVLASISEAVKAEKAYLAEVLKVPAGIKGMGRTASSDQEGREKLKAVLIESYKRSGKNDEDAKKLADLSMRG